MSAIVLQAKWCGIGCVRRGVEGPRGKRIRIRVKKMSSQLRRNSCRDGGEDEG